MRLRPRIRRVQDRITLVRIEIRGPQQVAEEHGLSVCSQGAESLRRPQSGRQQFCDVSAFDLGDQRAIRAAQDGDGRQVGPGVGVEEETSRGRETVGVFGISRGAGLACEDAGFLCGRDGMIRGFGCQSPHSPVVQSDPVHHAIIRIGARFAFVPSDVDEAACLIQVQYVANGPRSRGKTPLQTPGHAVIKIKVTVAVALGKPQDIVIRKYIDHGTFGKTRRLDKCIAGFRHELPRCAAAGVNEIQAHAFGITRPGNQVHARAVRRPPRIAALNRCKEQGGHGGADRTAGAIRQVENPRLRRRDSGIIGRGIAPLIRNGPNAAVRRR